MLYGYLILDRRPSDNVQVQGMNLLSTTIQVQSVLLILMTIDNEYDSMILIALVIVIVIDLLFMLYILRRLLEFYYLEIMISLYLKWRSLERYSLVKNALRRMESQKLANQRWQKIRLFTH